VSDPAVLLAFVTQLGGETVSSRRLNQIRSRHPLGRANMFREQSAQEMMRG